MIRSLSMLFDPFAMEGRPRFARRIYPKIRGWKYPPAGPDSREAKRRRAQAAKIAARRAAE
jgi:hypothetical protein